MKFVYILIAIIFIAVSICYINSNEALKFANASALSRQTVVIDAGHGGKDAGTSGVDGTPEKEINLAFSYMLYDFLMVSGINCELVRKGDYQIYYSNEERNRSDLYNRLDFVNSIENSVLVSIHQNHFEDEAEWGTQIWYSPNGNESKMLADSVLSVVKELIQPQNKRENKISDDSYYILYKASVPSIMIECGFMSNRKENELLKKTDYQKEYSYAVLLGICGEV